MTTVHHLVKGDARDLKHIKSSSIDLVITSPPYPMIRMWDNVFSTMRPEIGKAITEGKGQRAFEMMHQELDKAWEEVYRVLKLGGIACINIGDATRKIGDDFQLYPNHSRILECVMRIGFQVLPWIIWKKPTNSPTKFMGSGMIPPGAYVTLEHEFILILRKGGRREFSTEEMRERRRKSAYFWEERNQWFSDIWYDLAGAGQSLEGNVPRERSAAFPIELPYRLIQMYSIQNDIVLDPFVGTGTTTLAALLTGRNSIGVDIEEHLFPTIIKRMRKAPEIAHMFVKRRFENHQRFITQRESEHKKTQLRYINKYLNTPVMSRQEIDLQIVLLRRVEVVQSNKLIGHYDYFSNISSIEPVR